MMSNSVLGRTLMDPLTYSVTKDTDISKSVLRRRLRDPLFKRVIALRDDGVIIVRGRKIIYINQPNFIGYQIPEL